MSHLTPPFILAMLLALSVHESAHGLVALWLGDRTAKDEGRITLNPLAHIDLLGMLMFLTVGFGWAKPVPIDPRAFRNVKSGVTLTALAGPVSNLLLAIATALGILLFEAIHVSVSFGVAQFFREFSENMLFLNLGLMAFNLLPVAPLDGSKILAVFIPWRYERQYETFLRQGPILLLILLIAERLLGIPLLVWWITLIVSPILGVLEKLL
jgi:Zn-dependent protease